MARYADTPSVHAEITITAPPEAVWALVTDIELMARLSTELQEAHWSGDSSGPVMGARFSGRNMHPAIGEWWTTSHVIECTAPSAFAWAVNDVAQPSATWRFNLREQDGVTVLRQSARIGPGRSGLNNAIDQMPEKEERIVANRLREFRDGIEANLAAYKEIAEGAQS